MTQNRRKLMTVLFVLFLSVIAVAAFMVFKGDTLRTGSSANPESTDGFTFFEVGPGTEFTMGLKDELGDKLGSGSVETWSTINLEFHHGGFNEEHLPVVHQLNRKLNDARGQRVEHNTVRLVYRYIPEETTPFDYAELLFSGYTGLPLYCLVKAKRDGDEILSVLKTKYGEPKRTDWGKPGEYSDVWEKSGDYLVFSNTPDLLNNPAYQIVIYYVGNIRDLIGKEEREAQEAAKEKEDALKKAF